MMITEFTELADGKQQFNSQQPFMFDSGVSIPSLTLAFETYGTLSPAKDNVIVVHHALSSSCHLSSHSRNANPGWWEKMVGAGKPLDTNHYFVICINNLGSCFGSSGPSTINPDNQQAYRSAFPQVSIADMVRSQYLLLQALGIDCIHAMISSSMGAMLSLTWSILYPQSVKHVISISSCYRSYPSNIAIRSIQRDIIRMDPMWQNGDYTDKDLPGFILARKLAHISYRNTDEINHRFLNLEQEKKHDRNIHTYLEYNARKFTDRFDANSYLYLTQAMDDFNVARGYDDPLTPFRQITAKFMVISVSSDTLFEPYQQRELYQMLLNAGVSAEFIEHHSDYGHDTFLMETVEMGKYITGFIGDGKSRA